MLSDAPSTSWETRDRANTHGARARRGRRRLRPCAAVRGLTDDAARAPSRLPGWTRGHVLTHLARNAEGTATWSKARSSAKNATSARWQRSAHRRHLARRPVVTESYVNTRTDPSVRQPRHVLGVVGVLAVAMLWTAVYGTAPASATPASELFARAAVSYARSAKPEVSTRIDLTSRRIESARVRLALDARSRARAHALARRESLGLEVIRRGSRGVHDDRWT